MAERWLDLIDRRMRPAKPQIGKTEHPLVRVALGASDGDHDLPEQINPT